MDATPSAQPQTLSRGFPTPSIRLPSAWRSSHRGGCEVMREVPAANPAFELRERVRAWLGCGQEDVVERAVDAHHRDCRSEVKRRSRDLIDIQHRVCVLESFPPGRGNGRAGGEEHHNRLGEVKSLIDAGMTREDRTQPARGGTKGTFRPPDRAGESEIIGRSDLLLRAGVEAFVDLWAGVSWVVAGAEGDEWAGVRRGRCWRVGIPTTGC